MDPVTHYLAQQGVEVAPAYFESSQFEWGKSWDTKCWSLVYRVDDNTMTICDFSSKANSTGISSAVSQLIEQLKQIRHRVPEIKQIRGMVIHDACLPTLSLTRKALQDVLLKQGAKKVNQTDGTWLVY